jgi:5-methylcytosine-specific restriction endonuclease McrA
MTCAVHKHNGIVSTPLDVHHIWPLGEGGPDNDANTVKLCPNGHRRVHDYFRLLKKHNGKVPWMKRKFYGHKVRNVAVQGYTAMIEAEAMGL